MLKKIALTPGEPAGIGPDLCVLLSQNYLPHLYKNNIWPVIIADPNLLERRAQALQQKITIHTDDSNFAQHAGKIGHLLVHSIPLITPCTPQKPNIKNAAYVLSCLDTAITGCMNHTFAALVTGPIHKATIVESGVAFTGHTEYLQQAAQVDHVLMTFYCQQMILALATTHLPLSQVAQNITYDRLYQTIKLLHTGLIQDFAINRPRIAVCGLNPHAGEQGCLGNEEQKIISPIINQLAAEGLQISGPHPADTVFTPHHLQQVDAVLAMYHDQGLPVLKHSAFDEAVNVTLGLPFIRTSVDHGTALELAGTGKIMTQNMRHAIELSLQLISTHPNR